MCLLSVQLRSLSLTLLALRGTMARVGGVVYWQCRGPLGRLLSFIGIVLVMLVLCLFCVVSVKSSFLASHFL